MLRNLLTGLLVLALVSPVAAVESVSQTLLERLVRTIQLGETDPDAALEEMSRMAQRARRNEAALTIILQERAQLLLREDRISQARSELAAVFEDQEDGFAPELRLVLAQAQLLDGAFAEAARQLRIWRAQFERPTPAGLFLLGYANVQLEDFDAAVEALETALDLHEGRDRPQWVELLAYTYTRLGRTADAIALLERMIARIPGHPRWWRQLASNHLLADNLPPGTAAMWLASLVEEAGWQDRRRLARLYAALGMPADGATLLADHIDDPSITVEYDDWMLLGELWMLARETPAAIATFERAATVADDGEAQLMIAQLHVVHEDYQPAAKALQRAIDAYGPDAVPARAWYLLAVVEIHRDNPDAASRVLQQIADDPAYAARAARLAKHLASMGN